MVNIGVGDDYYVWLHKVISQDSLVLFRQGHVFHYYSFSLFFQSQAEEGNHLPDIGPSPSFDFLDFAVAMDYLQAASATSSHCLHAAFLESICYDSCYCCLSPCSVDKYSQGNPFHILSVALVFPEKMEYQADKQYDYNLHLRKEIIISLFCWVETLCPYLE